MTAVFRGRHPAVAEYQLLDLVKFHELYGAVFFSMTYYLRSPGRIIIVQGYIGEWYPFRILGPPLAIYNYFALIWKQDSDGFDMTQHIGDRGDGLTELEKMNLAMRVAALHFSLVSSLAPGYGDFFMEPLYQTSPSLPNLRPGDMSHKMLASSKSEGLY
ncbi:unnamed protein product [Protopolystoma xenopodis]|uniref:Uncharacterized protein n=1 Tax=Protopolystoma xenopodis TaxID=117903 RepID=A0A3S5C631_9PLAT|nr:unnamed protein product [Protopolystoma xenopodis]